MKQNKKLYKFVSFILRPIIKILFPCEIKGLEKLEKLNGGYILCANHLSNMDPIFLILFHPKPICFMAKQELFKNKILGRFFSSLGAFAVKRGKGDRSALDNAKQVLENSDILGIFIEGTRSKTGEFLRPKSGAALLAYETKSTVVTACITGASKDNKIRLFKKTTIEYSDPIDFKELGINEGTRLELKSATNLIMDKIKELRS